MKASTLVDLITAIDSLDPELTIYARKPWTSESDAIVALEPAGGGLPVEAVSLGARYFLEVHIATEVLEGFVAEAPESPSALERCARVIRYAIDDA